MNCPSCGSELPAAAKFCGSCGYQMTASAGGVATASASASSLSSLDRMRSYDELASSSLNVSVGEVLSEGWELTKSNFGLLIGAFVVYAVISMAAGFVPFGSLVVGGPLMGGLLAIALRLVAGRPAEFNNLFDGFKRFVPLMLVQIVMGLLVGFGMLLLFLPGLYLAIAFAFGTHLVVDRDEEFWPALMGSMKVVNGHFATMAIFALLVGLIVFVSALPLGLGLIVTGPWAMMSSAVLYKRVFGIAGGAERMGG